jgi:hypothetical protein
MISIFLIVVYGPIILFLESHFFGRPGGVIAESRREFLIQTKPRYLEIDGRFYATIVYTELRKLVSELTQRTQVIQNNGKIVREETIEELRKNVDVFLNWYYLNDIEIDILLKDIRDNMRSLYYLRQNFIRIIYAKDIRDQYNTKINILAVKSFYLHSEFIINVLNVLDKSEVQPSRIDEEAEISHFSMKNLIFSLIRRERYLYLFLNHPAYYFNMTGPDIILNKAAENPAFKNAAQNLLRLKDFRKRIRQGEIVARPGSITLSSLVDREEFKKKILMTFNDSPEFTLP